MTRSNRSVRAISDDQLAYIREQAGRLPDYKIAQNLGMHVRKVLYYRTQLGLEAYEAPSVWNDETTDKAHQLYIVQGLPSSAVGKALGIDPAAVRRKANRMGWDRDPSIRFRNGAAAQQARRGCKNNVVNPRIRPAKPEPSRLVGASDQDLIADFLARKQVTVLPPGHACGLTALEGQLGAYKPMASWFEQRLRAHADAKARKAALKVAAE